MRSSKELTSRFLKTDQPASLTRNSEAVTQYVIASAQSDQEMMAAAFSTAAVTYSSSDEMAKHYDQVAGTFPEHFAKASVLAADAKGARGSWLRNLRAKSVPVRWPGPLHTTPAANAAKRRAVTVAGLSLGSTRTRAGAERRPVPAGKAGGLTSSASCGAGQGPNGDRPRRSFDR